MKNKRAKMGGFTLVELLVVIGILTVLTAIVLVAVNPGRQMAQARDTQRRADVNTIISAISAYVADPTNSGALPAGLTMDCATGTQNIGTGVGGLDLAASVVPTYVADIPLDPSGGTAADTGYDACLAAAAANRVTVSAPNTELAGTTISATR